MVMPQELNRRKIILMAFVLATLLIILTWAGLDGNKDRPAAIITFNSFEGNVSFNCEVADTPSERAIGLMNRENLDADEGMLFMFESPQNISFWMKNTLIPLDIIFIDESGIVVNIELANPEPGVSDADLERYSSDRPIIWVLEINQGLCANYGITPGTSVSVDMK
jgi:uncharacterized membrane protein (UPF0127 family)